MSEQKARRVNQERTSLATAIAGMKHWDWCPICRGGLDTGLECDQCGADLMPIFEAYKESLSGGNPGEPKACTGAEERGISGATGAGQLPDGNPESTGDSADRRSPGGTERTPSPDESHRHFERGCHIIMELMQAYERRVRSDCTTQEQIDKRPWECAEYIKAAEYLRKVWPPHEPLAGWIAVTDRLPEWTEDRRAFVLVYSDSHDWQGTQFAVMRQSDFWDIDPEGDGEPGTDDARVVTHWRELRAPQTKEGI